MTWARPLAGHPFLPFLLSQGGWIGVAKLAAAGHAAWAAAVAAAVAAAIFALAEQRTRTAIFAISAAVIGPLADVALVHAGLITLREPPFLGVAMPPWWCGLWAMFGAALPASFGWLRRRPWTAAALGAAGGPPAYGAGAALGAIVLHPDVWPSLAAIACTWAVLMPLAVAGAARIVRPRDDA